MNAYVEEQQRRWRRHDAHLWLREDHARFAAPGAKAAKARDAARDVAFDRELAAQREVLASLKAQLVEIENALLRRRIARSLKAGFNPNQPRVPMGDPRGGQWTKEPQGGGGGLGAALGGLLGGLAGGEGDFGGGDLGGDFAAGDFGLGDLNGDFSDLGDLSGLDAFASADEGGEVLDGKPLQITIHPLPKDETNDGNSLSGVRLAGEIPTGDSPPEIPVKRPEESPDRTAVLKYIARRIAQTGETVAAFATIASWIVPYEAKIVTYNDPPASLLDLQRNLTRGQPGYHIHHVVEQTSAEEDGFPRSAIDDPSNLVRVPAMKHEEINAWYQKKNRDFGGESPRDYLRGRSWQVRRAVGLDALRRVGVLAP